MFARARHDRMNVFIHVPKTAGSTVNAHLAGWAQGQDHLENLRDKPRALRKAAKSAQWVSGHLALNKMQDLLVHSTDRPLAIYGLIRDPVKQVASHYNWLIEIAHRGGRFFRSHPQGVQGYSARLRASDNADPDVIVANIQARRGMFLNLQSRFLLGDDLKFSENAGLDRLRQYAGLTSDPDQLVEWITGTKPVEVRRDNASPYHFDPKVFESDAVQDFLRRNHGHDLLLFKRITQQQA